VVWTEEITEGRPPRCQAMTGLRDDQVAHLATAVFGSSSPTCRCNTGLLDRAQLLLEHLGRGAPAENLAWPVVERQGDGFEVPVSSANCVWADSSLPGPR
jgi:hypothetical protein